MLAKKGRLASENHENDHNREFAAHTLVYYHHAPLPLDHVTFLVSFNIFEMECKAQEMEKDEITVRKWNGDAVALIPFWMICGESAMDLIEIF